VLTDETEQYGEVANDQEGRTDEADPGKRSWHQARLVQQKPQQEVGNGRHETLTEEEYAVIQGDERMADG
jgi:hypothetical protein